MITREFLTAGRAIFTVSNPKGERYTFRVSATKSDGVFNGSYLAGQNNETSYRKLGTVYAGSLKFLPWNRSHYAFTKPFRVFEWVVRLLRNKQKPPPGYTVQHAGRCGKCGRLLTVPESIESGLGPECSKKMRG